MAATASEPWDAQERHQEIKGCSPLTSEIQTWLERAYLSGEQAACWQLRTLLEVIG